MALASPESGTRPLAGSLDRALEGAALPLRAFEVRALAWVASLVAIPPVTAACALARIGGVPWFAVLPLLAMPLVVAASVLAYPESLAVRERIACLGQTPEVVSYLAMSLRVQPSLERSVAFAAEHSSAPFSRHLRRALWAVHLRSNAGIEEAMTSLADRAGPWNPEFQRAVRGLIGAANGPDASGEALDRARAVAYQGARQRWREYAGSLHGPTTGLFALGVLLPLILGSMLPLLALGGIAPSSLESTRPAPGSPVPWILLLVVVFPALTFFLAHRASSGRPGAVRASRRPPGRWRQAWVVPPLLAVVSLGLVPGSEGLLPGMGAAIGTGSVILFLETRAAERQRVRITALLREFPDGLYRLGTRLTEGRGLEAALLAEGGDSSGTPLAELFGRIARSLRLGGRGTASAIGENVGDDSPVPVRACLRMVGDIAAKDPESAGTTVTEMATHLRDLEDLERDLRAELRPTIDAMRTTVVVFAPIVLGVTGALYELLARAFQTLAALPMAVGTFQAALAAYLALETIAILHFLSRIEGPGAATLGASAARILPIGFGVFVATLAVARLLL